MAERDDKDSLEGSVDLDTPPWLQAVPEDEVDGSSGMPGRTMLFGAGGAIALLVVFGVALFAVYNSAPTDPIHVRAPTGAVRERPQDPGGLEVQHQDKVVFERGAGRAVEQDATLQPLPEEPVSVLPELSPAGDTSADQSDAASAVTAPSSGDPEAEAEPAATQPTAEPSVPAQSEPVAQPAPEPEQETPVAPSTAAPEADNSVYRVQLGAYGSQAGAERAWRTLRGKFSNQLSALSPVYQATQRPGGTTLYRLRVEPLADQASADALCVALKAEGQGCIVVRP